MDVQRHRPHVDLGRSTMCRPLLQPAKSHLRNLVTRASPEIPTPTASDLEDKRADYYEDIRQEHAHTLIGKLSELGKNNCKADGTDGQAELFDGELIGLKPLH